MVKNPCANAGDARDAGKKPGSGRSSGVGHSKPLRYSCLENSMGRGAWVGYSPWPQKESDTTEHTSTHPFYCIECIFPFHSFCHINLLVNCNSCSPCHLPSSLSLSPLNHLFIFGCLGSSLLHLGFL